MEDISFEWKLAGTSETFGTNGIEDVDSDGVGKCWKGIEAG